MPLTHLTGSAGRLNDFIYAGPHNGTWLAVTTQLVLACHYRDRKSKIDKMNEPLGKTQTLHPGTGPTITNNFTFRDTLCGRND